MIERLASMKQLAVGLALAGALCAPAQAAPTFQIGMENTVGFHGAANGVVARMAVGSQIYGIISADSISSTGGTTWNAENTNPPYDSLTGYFAAKVASTTTSSGITTVNLAPLTAGDTPTPGMSFVADGQTIFDLYADTGTAFESNGPTAADDIPKAVDGTHWADLGITNGGYWTVTMMGPIVSSAGAMNFTGNDSGLSWAKVAGTQTTCAGSGGCDMKFSNSFSARDPQNGWTANLGGTMVVHPVPVPAAAWLLFSGLAGLVGVAKRKRHIAVA